MSDPTAHRKPPGLIWLLAPFLLFGAILVALTFVWWTARFQIEDAVRRERAALGQQGYDLDVAPLVFGGYPYRLSVEIAAGRLSTPSGWAVRIKGMKGQATLIDLDHWVFSLADGMTVTRPIGGDVKILGSMMRGSIVGLSRPVPRIALEVVDFTVSTPPGARPFSLAGARRLEIYTRAGVQDPTTAEALIRLEDATITPGTPLGPRVGPHRLTTALSLRLTKVSSLRGSNWTEAGRTWSQAGGLIELDPTAPPSSDVQLSTTGARLTFTADGRPTGTVPLILKSHYMAEPDRLSLAFQGGMTRLGPLTLGPCPRLF